MWLIVGLGNPGTKYQLTRHNVGFMAVDALNESLERLHWTSQSKSELIKTKLRGQNIILLKPQTFMNLSGESVQAIMQFYKIDIQNLIVAHDDIDQGFGSIRIHKNRGHGGHNGVRDISAKLGTADYLRLKLGVGRPTHPEFAVADYVLSQFSKEEFAELPGFLSKAGDAIESIIMNGHQKAATEFNT